MDSRTTISKAVAVGAITVLSLASCVNDELFDTLHPDKGVVAVMADFSDKSLDADIPEDFLFRHGCCGAETSYTMPAGGAECCPGYFTPGTHTFYAWTLCDNMTVADGTCVVDEDASGRIVSMPGYLFTSRADAVVAQGDTTRLNLQMAQRVRDLRLEFTASGNAGQIASAGGMLSGIAGAFSMSDQKITGDAASTALVFACDGDKIVAEARLLGVLGTAQSLELELQFAGSAETCRVTVDLSEALSDFNGDMTTTREIAGRLEMPADDEAGVSATITGWKDVEGEPVTAE